MARQLTRDEECALEIRFRFPHPAQPTSALFLRQCNGCRLRTNFVRRHSVFVEEMTRAVLEAAGEGATERAVAAIPSSSVATLARAFLRLAHASSRARAAESQQ